MSIIKEYKYVIFQLFQITKYKFTVLIHQLCKASQTPAGPGPLCICSLCPPLWVGLPNSQSPIKFGLSFRKFKFVFIGHKTIKYSSYNMKVCLPKTKSTNIIIVDLSSCQKKFILTCLTSRGAICWKSFLKHIQNLNYPVLKDIVNPQKEVKEFHNWLKHLVGF